MQRLIVYPADHIAIFACSKSSAYRKFAVYKAKYKRYPTLMEYCKENNLLPEDVKPYLK